MIPFLWLAPQIVDLYTKTKTKRNELLIIITHPQILQQAKSQIEYWKGI